MKNLIPTSEHWGEYQLDSENHGYKSIVISGPIQGRKGLIFGRLIQVRKQSGAFGTDTILIRDAEGALLSFHNMGFFSVKPEFLPMYTGAMFECDLKNLDSQEDEYSIEQKNPAVGFIVHGLDDTFGKEYSFAMAITVKTNNLRAKRGQSKNIKH